jgi:hypothetical protein
MDSLITAAARALAAGDPLGALKRVALRERRFGSQSFKRDIQNPPTSHSRAIAGHPELGRYRIARDVPSANRGEVMSPPKESKGSPTVRRSGRFAA